MPEFSIVIIIKQRRKQLANLFDSILHATLLPYDVQVVCMDDPGNITIPDGLNVKLLRLKSHAALPLAAARNMGMASAQTAHIIFIDVDCIVSPSLFTSLLRSLSMQSVVTAYPLYLPIVPNSGDFEALRLQAVDHPARRTIPSDTAVPPLNFWSIIFAIHKQAFENTEGFDEAFTGYGAEDTDFAKSFDKAGMRLVFVRDYILHQYHDKYDPPLNYFNDIVQNARTYHAKWGDYPMHAWLTKCVALGLLQPYDDTTALDIIRWPSQAEINACKSTQPY